VKFPSVQALIAQIRAIAAREVLGVARERRPARPEGQKGSPQDGQIFRCVVAEGEGGARSIASRPAELPADARGSRRAVRQSRDGRSVVRKGELLGQRQRDVVIVLPPVRPSGSARGDRAHRAVRGEALIVIDKPAGMATHPAPGAARHAGSALLHRWRFGGDGPIRSGRHRAPARQIRPA
jgi:hypothetical protein